MVKFVKQNCRHVFRQEDVMSKKKSCANQTTQKSICIFSQFMNPIIELKLYSIKFLVIK